MAIILLEKHIEEAIFIFLCDVQGFNIHIVGYLGDLYWWLEV